jgi:4-amino-4-deoxy-L-arabinose transferase-like glycosyltransferase
MFHILPIFSTRFGHYALLVAAAAGLFLINLGVPSLWDIDEGHNAEAAREMLISGNWVVPTFNFQLRPDKPALLYWLQIGAYHLLGVNEQAARLPSALAALAAILVTYELGRRMFTAATGLLAGLILASTVLFSAAAHFANPDALLCCLSTLTLAVFWIGYAGQHRSWFMPAGIVSGLAVLAKGPVGLILPAAVAGVFLLWERQLRQLWNRRLILGVVAFLIVVLPWYAWVGVQTRSEFLLEFLLKHNLGRFRATMENHHGPILYYVAWLIVGFTPWSIFLGPALWYSRVRRPARAALVAEAAGDPVRRSAYRFLLCWIAVYFIFFSASATKLPNYILPLYPAVAILSACFLERWRLREIEPRAWQIHACLGCLAFVGALTTLGLLAAGGAVTIPLVHFRPLRGLEEGAVLGVVPLFGAALAGWCLRRDCRGAAVVAVALTALLFVGMLGTWGTLAVDAHKSTRPLVAAFQARQQEPDIRVACYQYYQPSLVFYCGREVDRLGEADQALAFLRYPIPVYLFLPASAWDKLQIKLTTPHHVLGRHADLYRQDEILVVTNR